MRTYKKYSKKYSRKRKYRKSKKINQRGSGKCDIATVKESGFNIPNIGDIAGLSIPESRGVIYKPNCKTDSYHANV